MLHLRNTLNYCKFILTTHQILTAGGLLKLRKWFWNYIEHQQKGRDPSKQRKVRMPLMKFF